MKYTTTLPFTLLATSIFPVVLGFSAAPLLTSTHNHVSVATNRHIGSKLPSVMGTANNEEVSKFGWQKAPPKASLVQVEQDHTAPQWFLNLVEGVHYATFPITFLSSVAVMQYHDVWSNMLGNDALRLTLWMAAPLAQACAGLAPIVMHVYEDWQVAPALKEDGNMVLSRSDEEQDEFYSIAAMPNVEEANNERLRQAAYSLLFTGLGIGSTMSFHAYQGWSDSPWGPLSLLTSAALLAYSCYGDKNNLISKALDKPSLVPISVPTLIWLIYSQIMVFAFAYLPLAFQLGEGNYGLKAMVVIPQFLTAAGGMVEGLLGETTYDQRWHLVAVMIIGTGAALQCAALYQVGAYLS